MLEISMQPALPKWRASCIPKRNISKALHFPFKQSVGLSGQAETWSWLIIFSFQEK